MLQENIILNVDSYKTSQAKQYPPGTVYVRSYIESRGGAWDATVFFGLQMFIKAYLLKPITAEMIDEAEEIITAHGEPFYREGWEFILNECNGYLPISIKALPEGTIIRTKNVLAVVENTRKECWWLTSYLETAILRAVWYPTTVATNSFESKKIINEALKRTGDPSGLSFKLHDFGARGVSSLESAGIGGAAHLVNFMGTDTISALIFARKYYGAQMAGFSVPASEHSTITSWGREREADAYRNMLRLFGKPNAIVSVVSDSYDIENACENIWGGTLRKEVLDSGAVLVVRPDSGDPTTIVVSCVRLLDKQFGHTINEKGFRVLNNVRVIQGDGIDHFSIRSILTCLEIAGYSADNVTFGQGGALLQQINRDTLKFAMKCSQIGIETADGIEYRDVFKDPITDPGKVSKKGRVTLYKSAENGEFYSAVEPIGEDAEALVEVYRDGALLVEQSFDEIRARAAIPFN